MENDKFCEQTDIDWEDILQRLPESQGICFDDFLFPLSTEGEPGDLLSLPSFDEDGKNEEALAEKYRDSSGLWLSSLSNILFNDEDFEKFPAGEDGGGFIDINSFLADAKHSADMITTEDEIKASEREEIQLGGKKEGQFLASEPEAGKKEKTSGKMGSFTRKRKR